MVMPMQALSLRMLGNTVTTPSRPRRTGYRETCLSISVSSNTLITPRVQLADLYGQAWVPREGCTPFPWPFVTLSGHNSPPSALFATHVRRRPVSVQTKCLRQLVPCTQLGHRHYPSGNFLSLLKTRPKSRSNLSRNFQGS